MEETYEEGPVHTVPAEIERLHKVEAAAKAVMNDLTANRPSFADGALMRNLADALKSAK